MERRTRKGGVIALAAAGRCLRRHCAGGASNCGAGGAAIAGAPAGQRSLGSNHAGGALLLRRHCADGAATAAPAGRRSPARRRGSDRWAAITPAVHCSRGRGGDRAGGAAIAPAMQLLRRWGGDRAGGQAKSYKVVWLTKTDGRAKAGRRLRRWSRWDSNCAVGGRGRE